MNITYEDFQVALSVLSFGMFVRFFWSWWCWSESGDGEYPARMSAGMGEIHWAALVACIVFALAAYFVGFWAAPVCC